MFGVSSSSGFGFCLFFFMTDHLFLTWVCFLLIKIAFWSFLMSNVSCLLTKSICQRPCKEGKGQVKRTKTTEALASWRRDERAETTLFSE